MKRLVEWVDKGLTGLLNILISCPVLLNNFTFPALASDIIKISSSVTEKPEGFSKKTFVWDKGILSISCVSAATGILAKNINKKMK